MFGIKHIKFDSMTYVLHFKNGSIKREGRGLSFFYFVPNSSIAAIPMGSNDLPFIFNESTNDYQTISIQGQISYKISNPKTLADTLDFTVTDNGQYKKNDIEKLNQRIINGNKKLRIESLMPSGGVIFSDGIEADFLQFNSGAIAGIGIATETATIVSNAHKKHL